jgi:hypothetical protein
MRVSFRQLRVPRWLMTPLLQAANRLHSRPLLIQDGFAVEADQVGYEAHFTSRHQ